MGIYKKTIVSFSIAATICTAMAINSCTHQPYVMPVSQRTGDPSICFERDILPIFQSNCAKSGCHDASSHVGGYVLDSYTNIMKNGIVPGNIAASVIWESIGMNGVFDTDPMPKDAPALPAAALNLIQRWIETGAIDSGACNTSTCDTSKYTYSGAVAPIMQLYCTGCHNSSSAPGGSLMDYGSVRTAAVNGKLLGDILHQPGYNAMPQGGAMLQDCQITQIKKWVAAGALNN